SGPASAPQCQVAGSRYLAAARSAESLAINQVATTSASAGRRKRSGCTVPKSGRPGSNRRRPAWEAFWALAGQGFFAGGSRKGITEYCRDPVLFDNFAVRPLAGWLVFAARDRSRRPRSQTPTAGVAVRPAAYPA